MSVEIDSLSLDGALSYDSVDTQESMHTNGWDRTFFDLSSKCAAPLCKAFELIRFRLIAPLDPNKFAILQNRVAEIAYRALIAIGALALAATTVFTGIALLLPMSGIPLTVGVLPGILLGLGLASKVFKVIALKLQKNSYTHTQTNAPEKPLNGSAKIMTWNIGGIAGGMHYDHCGVESWQKRIDAIIEKISIEDPDVLILQEIYDTALSEALIEKLGEQYAHFFTQLGPNLMGSVGGVMIITKNPVHSFTSTSFENNDWTLNRTFSTLEIKENPNDTAPALRIIGTHLIHDNNENRKAQFQQIRNSITDTLPTILAGDLNMERNDPNQGGILSEYLIHSYNGSDPTATNELVAQWDPTKKGTPSENIDYISLFKTADQIARFEKTHLIEAFRDMIPKTALSDHNGMITTLHYTVNS